MVKPTKTMRQHILEQKAKEEARAKRESTKIRPGMTPSQVIRAKIAKQELAQENAAKLALKEKRAKKAEAEKPVKVKKVRKARYFQGNAPEGERWGLLGYVEYNDISWRVYFSLDDDDVNACYVKIAAVGLAPRKANFGLRFFGDKLVICPAAECLLTHSPELFTLARGLLIKRWKSIKDVNQYLTDLYSRYI